MKKKMIFITVSLDYDEILLLISYSIYIYDHYHKNYQSAPLHPTNFGAGMNLRGNKQVLANDI